MLHTDDLVSGDNVFFVATGITDGELLRGVRYRAGGATTHSLVMRSRSGTIRVIESQHRLTQAAGVQRGGLRATVDEPAADGRERARAARPADAARPTCRARWTTAAPTTCPAARCRRVVLVDTDGQHVDLATLPGRSVVYAYPRTGRPGRSRWPTTGT